MNLSEVYEKGNRVGAVFGALRRGVGVQQKQVEARLRVGKGWLSYREKTKRHLRVVDMLLISAAVGVHPLTLFVGLLIHFGRFDDLPKELSVAMYRFYCDDVIRAALNEKSGKMAEFDKEVTDE